MPGEPAASAAALPRPGRAARRRRVGPYAWAAGAGVAVLVTDLVHLAADHPDLRLFDASAEWSWSHVAASGAMAAAALAGVAGARRGRGRPGAWWTTAGLFGVLLLDNVTRLHTHVGAWPVIYLPILGGIAAAAWTLARGSREAPVVAAALLTLVASLAVHVLGPSVVHALGQGGGSWAYQVKSGLKEATELAGWVLLVPALWRLARS